MPIFPNLRDLKLNLYDEDHVDFIIKNMPQLEFLNGLPVEREDEEDEYSAAAPSRRERTASSSEKDYQGEHQKGTTTLVIEDEPNEDSY